MPSKPPVACGYPRCPGFGTRGNYCDKHRPTPPPPSPSHSSKAYNERSKFYNTSAWNKARRAVLMDEPLCRECLKDDVLTDAEIVDHIKPRAEGGRDFDRDNLQPLCWSCHSRKTNRENRR